MKKSEQWQGYVGIMCLAFFLSLSAMGLGVAAWTEGLVVGGVVNTGNIDVAFDKCYVVKKHCSCDNGVSYSITEDGKKLIISVSDAYSGYKAHLKYKVVNRGTVPVKLVTKESRSSPALKINDNMSEGIINGNGDGREANLFIVVGECEESSTYNFEVELVFGQWNGHR